jgi:NADP-dependent 3-hydroxy acid dehydrogenase YdfG
MDAFGIPPEAVAEAIAFAVDQPSGVEIGEITVRPTVQN